MKRCTLLLSSLVLSLALTSAASAQAPKTKSGFVTTADGAKIHYIQAGTSKQPTILFVPGWTMPAWIWEHQIVHLAKTHRVVAMDPRSQGNSSQESEGLYPAARARDIKAVVDQLKLAPVVLVGWSMGVTEIAAYVDQFGTDGIAGIVLVDGIAGSDFDPKITPQVLPWAASFQVDRPKATAAFVRTMYQKPQSEEYLNRVTQAALRTPTNSAVALLTAVFTSDYRPALAKIDRPALVVVAGDEKTNPYFSWYKDVQQRISGAKLEAVPGTGHALFVDDAPRFNSLLDDFLRTLK